MVVEGAKKKASAKKAVKKAPATPAAAAPAPVVQPVAASTAPVEPADVPYTVPAGVSVVGEGEIDTFGQAKVDNVIRTLPGTFTRESPSNPGVAVNIRGFEGQGRVNQMIDGVRQNFRFTGHEAGGFVYVDPNLLAGIDVQRGAVSTAGGAGALVGTANFRTLDVADIVRAGQSVGALASLSWGSNGLGFSEMGAAGARSGGVGIAGAISKRNQDDYDNGEGTRVPFTDQDLISGLVKAELAIDDEQHLKFGGVFYDNDFSANGYAQNLNTKTYTIKYAYDPAGTELINLRLNASYNEVEMEYLRGLTSTSRDAGRRIEDQGWGFDATNVSYFNLGVVRVRSEYGYEYFKDDVDASNRVDPTLGGGVNPSGESSISSPFSQTTFSYGIFDLIGGLRYDSYALEGSGVAVPFSPFNPAGGPYSVDKEVSRWSPKVTLAATPLPWLQPYVTYSESMRAPTISETLTGGIHPSTTSAFEPEFAPNPFLDPEVQKGWEFGFNVRQDNLLQRGDAFRLKADYFTMDVEDYIGTCLNAGPPFTAPFPGGPLVVPTIYAFFCNARGTSSVDGVEVQATYDAGYYFGGASYTYTDTNLPSAFNGFGTQSYLPHSILTLTGGLRFLNEKLTVGARGYIVSEAYNGADQIQRLLGPGAPPSSNPNGNPNDPYTKPYELLDLFTSYKWSDSVEFGATVTNVFERTYSPALSTPVTGFTEETGRGRTFLVTTRAQF